MPSDKSPGPDGYTSKFYKATWDKIGGEFTIAIQSFFQTGFLPKGVNSTILALIPKKTEAREMKDYRPISCCNVIYKVISKLIANRLKTVLPKFISGNQSAFVKDRLLIENLLLATELVKDYHKYSISSRCAIKIDISKAFDSVQWSFILNALSAMAFPPVFIKWISLCISMASFLVQVNGELAGYFQSERGLRQGCSLSPYLFVISMDILSKMLDNGATLQQFGYHPKCKNIGLTHISFADDMMVLIDGKIRSIEGIVSIFDEFAKISGLKISMEKSFMYLAGITETVHQDITSQFPFEIGKLPVYPRKHKRRVVDLAQTLEIQGLGKNVLQMRGPRGIIDMGVKKNASLAEAWRTRRRRRHCIKNLNLIENALETKWQGRNMNAEDIFLWKGKDNSYKDSFSTKDTWNLIRKISNKVTWYKGVWLTHATPKYSFCTWLAMKNRLSTGDRMQNWNTNSMSTCVLCNSHLKTRDNLFFKCSYSSEIWNKLVQRLLHSHFSTDWREVVTCITNTSLDKINTFLVRCSFQIAVHSIWRERNGRRHGENQTSATQLAIWIDKQLLPELFLNYGGCVKKIESLCSRFLWSGNIDGSTGAKIAWSGVCLPKKEGGVGLRRFAAWNTTLCLRFIWLLFADNDSLWAKWHLFHHIKNKSLWEIDESSRDPWTWKMLLRLRQYAVKFLIADVRNGKNVSFWHDSWTPLGPLFSLFGNEGPRSLSIPYSAKVADACNDDGWILSSPRSDLAVSLHAHLTTIPLPSQVQDKDTFCWIVDGFKCRGFSSPKTWEALRPRELEKDWVSSVWFRGAVPRNAFNMWVTHLNRLPTRARLAAWGVIQSTECCLCSLYPETRDHLMLECVFAATIWREIMSRLTPNHRQICNWSELLSWTRHRTSQAPSTLRKVAVQAAIYHIWKQRNNVLHNNLLVPPSTIFKNIDREVRNTISDQIPTEEDFEVDTTFIDDEYLRYLHYLDSRSNHGVNTFGSYDEIFGLVLGNSSSIRRLNAAEELPVVEFTAEEMMERGLVVCAICREELAANERLSELPCRHYYHKNCISNWLSNRNTCPLCRHNVELPKDI
ncbi:Reverse transcriptase zinc-binding domain [Arabidopsis suecica]|uniref:Reverse transcriptase zinc-binding domain n=1 Tax=Arabidopsis suecica TaxID=45249 RepID=A0A8T1ZTL5_ARASU|nr:Reverse transcriptase zinc-binding domain [Arabidopsis suecica]